MNGDQLALAHVGQQDPDHAQRKVQVSGEISHRCREPAQLQQHQVLGLEVTRVDLDAANGGDHGDQVEHLAARAGPAAGDRVGADHGTGVLVNPLIVGRGHVLSLRLCVRAAGPGANRQVLPDPLDQDRHLVGHQSHIGRGHRQDREAAALTRGGHEQELGLHLDDDLAGGTAPELPPDPPGQALQAGRGR
jgi:hypothetical protein